MTLNRIIPLAAITLTFLAGCVPSWPQNYLELDADEILEPCTEIVEIPVETLDGAPPLCEPVGSTLVFPDGATIDVGAGGGSTSMFTDPESDIVSYGYSTVGIYGVVASAWVNECEDFQSWGRPDAIEKLTATWGHLGQC